MIKRILRRVLARVPFVKDVYRIIGLGFKVQALERSIAYYDVRIDKIYKNVTRLIAYTESLSTENSSLRSELARAQDSCLKYFPCGNEALWNEAELNARGKPTEVELREIFDNLEDPIAREYAETHYYRLSQTFDLLQSEVRSPPIKVVELGAAPFYNRKLLSVLQANEVVYVGKPFLNSSGEYAGKFIDFNLESSAWPIVSDSVDLFLAFELIEHFFIDPMAFFFEANRCLKQGGKIIITTPNVASWKSLRALITHYSPNFYVKFFPNIPLWESHRTEYTLKDIQEFARCSGFSCSISTFNSYSVDYRSCLTDFFDQSGWDVANRGDTLWAVFIKNSEPIDRYPEWFYSNYRSVAALYQNNN